MKKIAVLFLTLLFLATGNQAFSRDWERITEFDSSKIEMVDEITTIGRHGYIKFSSPIMAQSQRTLLKILASFERKNGVEITFWMPESSYSARHRLGAEKVYVGIWFSYY